MASRTGCWRRFIKQNRNTINRPLQRVAIFARNFLVGASQGEGRLLVIEERGLPLVRVMARRAIAASRAELIGMRVLVTILAGR